MNLLIIRSADNRDSDRYIGCPLNMRLSQGQMQADDIIKKLKSVHGDDVNWDEHIEPELCAAGFVAIDGWLHCYEDV